MALEVTEILLNAQSVDESVRKHAEERLKQYEEQETSKFLLSLSAELANDEKPVGSRKLAGLVLRDALYAKLDRIRFTLTDRWYSLDVDVQTEIEKNLLLTLKSCVAEARFTALQVIAKVDRSKLSEEEWLEHIGPLLRSSNQVGPDVSLETLGYVSWALGGDKQILEAIVEGMKASNDVRLAATRALYHALGFDQEKITEDIIEAVFDATVSTDVRIQQAAFECLLLMSSSYYEKLAPYLERILSITRKAVKQYEEPVALQAIEIWSLICDQEIDNEDYCLNHIERALSAGLVPMLLETLQVKEQQDGAWNDVAMAGRRCLGLVVQIVGDAIVPLVTPFVEENIKKPDWRQREAATYALGSVLISCPSLDKLAPLNAEATLSLMLTTLIGDPNNHLKDTTAWTLGRIFRCLCGLTPIVTPAYCDHIITVLLGSMKKDAPDVAEKACGALYNLVYYMNVSSGLTLSFREIVKLILRVVIERKESRLTSAACDTLKEVVLSSTEKEALQLLQIIKKDLQETLEEQNKQNERRLELLCWLLDKIFQRLVYSSFFEQHDVDGFMNLLFRVLACPGATAAHEEAMLAVATLAHAIGPDFVKHMPEFYTFLEKKLQNLEGSPPRECEVTLDVVGTIFKALKDKGLKWSESVMRELLGHYNQVDLSVKPLVISCFGDIATGLQDGFSVYFDPVFSLIHSAYHQIPSGVRDVEMMEHSQLLQAAAVNAYFHILHVLGKLPQS